jgi:hypothetical protein
MRMCSNSAAPVPKARYTDATTYHRDLRVVREDARERRNPIECDPTVIVGEGDHVTLSKLCAKVPTARDATRLRANAPQASVTERSDCNLCFITIALIDHEQSVEALVGQNGLGAGQGVVRAVPGYKSNGDSNGALALRHRQTSRLPCHSGYDSLSKQRCTKLQPNLY